MSTAVDKYQFGGWTDPRTIYSSGFTLNRPYGQKYGTSEWTLKNIWKRPMKEKIDAHEYVTEAKDLPIEACQNMWIIRYGDGAVDASVLVEQDDLIWEIGNRLFWAGLLEHDQQSDRYTCKS